MEVEHFSNSSIANYMRSTKLLCTFSGKLPDELSEMEIYEFLLHLKNDLKLSRSTIRNYLQGLRFMYKSIYKRIDIIADVPYPKATKFLPLIPTGKELLQLFNAAKSPKHRLLLKVIYSAGLRKSEIINLKIEHLDFKNHRIYIKDSKGNKDRYTVLAQSLIPEIQQYLQQFQPKEYLFNGRYKGKPYSDEAVKWGFQYALDRSGIEKHFTPHSLRHAFASHLLAMGVDIVSIQKMMGHDDIRTTMVYLHINNNLKSNPLVSPLDRLQK
ncbi:site-specific integrase [Marinilabiliaceae bacterium AAT]|uniref:Site-specific integrase n=2 Tax=Plebeiibacterium sediminum TaxID=2992112 RepID=A0AAE3MA20_9BACT|nr:tyrosine-type recombinase/integrase [Plebeiobacterium sediminum]MCW3789717.1 site-specific integrase [Plebeiobacterium sediminum]